MKRTWRELPQADKFMLIVRIVTSILVVVLAALQLLGVWVSFQKKTVNTVLGALGCIGMVVSEVYKFFTWHALTITGEISLQHSIRFAFPEFYAGLCVRNHGCGLSCNYS